MLFSDRLPSVSVALTGIRLSPNCSETVVRKAVPYHRYGFAIHFDFRHVAGVGERCQKQWQTVRSIVMRDRIPRVGIYCRFVNVNIRTNIVNRRQDPSDRRSFCLHISMDVCRCKTHLVFTHRERDCLGEDPILRNKDCPIVDCYFRHAHSDQPHCLEESIPHPSVEGGTS